MTAESPVQVDQKSILPLPEAEISDKDRSREIFNCEIAHHLTHINSLVWGIVIETRVASLESNGAIDRAHLKQVAVNTNQAAEGINILMDSMSELGRDWYRFKQASNTFDKTQSDLPDHKPEEDEDELRIEDVIASNMSSAVHDFKNTLGGITGYAQLAERKAGRETVDEESIRGIFKELHEIALKRQNFAQRLREAIENPYPDQGVKIEAITQRLQFELDKALLQYREAHPELPVPQIDIKSVSPKLAIEYVRFSDLWIDRTVSNLIQNWTRASERRAVEQPDRANEPWRISTRVYRRYDKVVLEAKDNFAGFPEGFKPGNSTTSGKNHGKGLPGVIGALNHYGGSYEWENDYGPNKDSAQPLGAIQRLKFKVV